MAYTNALIGRLLLRTGGGDTRATFAAAQKTQHKLLSTNHSNYGLTNALMLLEYGRQCIIIST